MTWPKVTEIAAAMDEDRSCRNHSFKILLCPGVVRAHVGRRSSQLHLQIGLFTQPYGAVSHIWMVGEVNQRKVVDAFQIGPDDLVDLTLQFRDEGTRTLHGIFGHRPELFGAAGRITASNGF